MANRFIVKVDGVQQKEIKLEADLTGLASGAHTLTVEKYQGTTLLESAVRNFSVASTTPPAAPTNLRFGTVTINSVEILWDPVADADSYTVDYRVDGNMSWATAVSNYTGGTSYTVTGLLEDTLYNFRVRSENEAGSGISASINQRTANSASAPLAITNILKEPSNPGELSVSWDASAGATSYEITLWHYIDEVNWTRVDDFVTTVNTNSWTGTGLDDSVFYTVEIVARNSVGDSPMVDIYTGSGIIRAPEITIGAITGSSVAFSWTGGGGPNDEFKIMRSVGGATAQSIGNTFGPSGSYTDTGLQGGTYYSYYFIAKSAQYGTRDWSYARGGTTEAAPSTWDADTTAYMDAVGIPNDSTVYWAGTAQEITGSELWTAINDCVTYLKDNSAWVDLRYFHPILGTTAAQRGKNLRNPSVFQMTYYGGWIFDEKGNKADGSTTYADWGFKPIDEITDSVGLSLATLSDSSVTTIEYGSAQTGYQLYLSSKTGGNARWMVGGYNSDHQVAVPTAVGVLTGILDSVGNHVMLKNGVVLYRKTNSIVKGTSNLTYGNGSTASYYTDRYLGSHAGFVNATEAKGLVVNTAMNNLEIALKRKA